MSPEPAIRPASREATNEIEEMRLTILVRKYLGRQGYSLPQITDEAILRNLRNTYSGARIVKDGKTFNQIAGEMDKH